MKKIGRNDPCPCGSGRKYKKCCLSDGGGLQAYTAEERASALMKMADFVVDGGWGDFELEAMDLFWDDLDEKIPGFEEDELLNEMSQFMFDFWFYFDFQIDIDRTLYHYFIDTEPDLTKGELSFLNMASRSCVRLYEAVKVFPGKSVTLKDLVRGAVMEVREIAGSKQMKRHDIMAARIMPVGASGWPEIDGGLYLFGRMHREQVVNRIQFAHEAFIQESPGSPDSEFFKEMPPDYHQMWLAPYTGPIPSVKTFDGNEMVISKAWFDVDDSDALKAVLDSQKDLERHSEGLNWTWLSKPKDGKKGIYGFFRLDGRRLILETTSREWVEKGKTKINRIAKGLARHRLTEYTSLEKAMEELKSNPSEPDKGLEGLSPADREQLDQALQKEQKKYYKKWLDMDIPMLDGLTPRQAARTTRLKPRMIEMLKDLEHMYETELAEGRPGFDPSWMWGELGLEKENPDFRDCSHPALTGAEAMERMVGGIEEMARKIAAGYRNWEGFHDGMTLEYGELEDNLDFQRFVRNHTDRAVQEGMDKDAAWEQGRLLASHLEYMINYELHLRKTFWIEDTLSYMLGHTELDLLGDMLKLPYASFAFVFTDRFTLEIAERMLSNIPDCTMGGRKLQILTVYVTQAGRPGGPRRVKIAFVFDAFIEQWPYLLVRELEIDPHDNLDQILAGHCEGGVAKRPDPVLKSELMGRMLHLVINAILYTTSADVVTETRPSPLVKSGRQAVPEGVDIEYLSSQEVIYLPGKINISHVKELQAVEKSDSGRTLMVKFMVRGHWRRANPKWKDQRPRWISPYWKGPDLATIIERQYRLTT